jgi:hypothetical protein
MACYPRDPLRSGDADQNAAALPRVAPQAQTHQLGARTITPSPHHPITRTPAPAPQHPHPSTHTPAHDHPITRSPHHQHPRPHLRLCCAFVRRAYASRREPLGAPLPCACSPSCLLRGRTTPWPPSRRPSSPVLTPSFGPRTDRRPTAREATAQRAATRWRGALLRVPCTCSSHQLAVAGAVSLERSVPTSAGGRARTNPDRKPAVLHLVPPLSQCRTGCGAPTA